MRRVSLDDGRWFDEDKAEVFDEDTYWDGRNNISVNTSSQWDHERVLRTSGGVWLLHYSSAYQSTRDSYELISEEEVGRWLSKNGHDLSDSKYDFLRSISKELSI